MPLDFNTLARQVEDGLKGEAQKRMGEAQEALDFYCYRGEQHMTETLAEHEGAIGSAKRRYRPSGLLREIVNVLTDHLYSPGPSRTWSEPAGDKLLQKVYADNHIDALMLRCDQLSTIGDAAAIQVDADLGQFEDKPICLRVWGPDEFHVWEDPDYRSRPAAVVTKDKYDEQTRYRLWTEESFAEFQTKKGGGTSGGRVAEMVGGIQDNPYGCIPFAFTHYEFPVQAFWEPGPSDLLTEAEESVNDRLSRLNQAIHAHLFPLPIMRNATPGQRIVVEPQRFIALPGGKPVMGKQGYETQEGPYPEFLQAHIDVASAWEDLRGYILQVLEACGVPQSAVRMEQQAVASGIALMVEQEPLVKRAEKRRGPFGVYEEDLARTILRCIAGYYRRADVLATAMSGKLSLGWPTPRIAVVTMDWLEIEEKKIVMGASSVVAFVQQIYGVQRERAIELLEQFRKDQDELERINPDLAPQPMDEQKQPGQNGQPREAVGSKAP